MGKKILKLGGYTVLFLILSFFFLLWNLPFDQLKDWTEDYARNKLGLELKIGEFDHGITAHTLKAVTIELPSRFRPDPALDEGIRKQLKRKKVLGIQSFNFDFGLWSAIRGKTEVKFDAKLAGGKISGGRFKKGRKPGFELKIGKLDGISLNKLQVMNWYLRSLIGGKLGGKLEIKHTGKLKELSADINIKLKAAFVRFLKLKLGTNDLPIRDGDLGDCTISIETMTKARAKIRKGRRWASDKVLLFKKLNCNGDDIEIRIQQPSYIELRDPFKFSQINLTLQIAFGKGKDFLKKNIAVKAFSTSRSFRAKYFSGDFFGVKFVSYLAKPRISMVRPKVRGTRYKSGAKRKRTIRRRPRFKRRTGRRRNLTKSRYKLFRKTRTFKPVMPLRRLTKPPPRPGTNKIVRRRRNYRRKTGRIDGKRKELLDEDPPDDDDKDPKERDDDKEKKKKTEDDD